MAHKTVLLISTDEEYNRNIEEQLASELGEHVQLEMITDRAYLEEYLKSPHKVDTLLTEEKLMPEITAAIAARAAFLLTEETGTGNQEISKYGGAQALIRALDPALLRNNGGIESRETKIIDICSVAGGSGKTSTALGVAARLASMGRKVLYISTESFQNFNSFLNTDSCMSDNLLKCMATHSNQLAETAVSEIMHGKFDYIPQIGMITSVYQVDEQSMLEMAEAIRQVRVYDYILIEHPEDITKYTYIALMKSERLIITTLQDKASYEKLKRLYSFTGSSIGECVIVCGKYHQDEYCVWKNDNEIKIPVSEYVPFSKDFNIENMENSGIYKATAEAIR